MEKKDKKSNTLVEVLKYVIPFVLAIVIFLIVKFVFLDANYSMRKVNVQKYQKLVTGKEQSLIYVTSDECNTCTAITSLLKKVLKGSSIKTYEINISTLSDDDLNTFMGTLPDTEEGITTPALVLVQDDKVVSSFYGPADEDVFVEFLENNNLIEK